MKLSAKVLAALIFLLSFGLLMWAESVLRPQAIVGIYFHGIPSETMMQTVSILDLKQHLFQSLWNIHIQPPMFDSLRGLLALFSGSSDSLQLQYFVDQGLYLIWGVGYGLIVALMFWWLAKISNIQFSLVATLIFAASPAALLYTTLLETTFLSSFLIFCFIYLLWKIKNSEPVSPFLLSLSFLALFFTRSIFQWQWIFIVAICLVLMKYPLSSLKKFIVISAVVMGLFLTKQFLLFEIASTSSFTGLNLCQSIRACKSHFITPLALDSGIPSVLSRDQKLTGAHNFNNLVDLELNKAYLGDYKEKLSTISVTDLISNYHQNLKIYFQPSSNYASTNTFLVSIPPRWKNYYEKFFSAPIFPILLVVSALFWIFSAPRKERLKSMGIFIPVFAIFTISILFESGENMRFKFFIEPVLYVFIMSQLYSAFNSSRNLLAHRLKRSSESTHP